MLRGIFRMKKEAAPSVALRFMHRINVLPTLPTSEAFIDVDKVWHSRRTICGRHTPHNTRSIYRFQSSAVASAGVQYFEL